MTTRLIHAALSALLLLGSACSKEPSAPPTPSKIETTTAPSSTATAGAAAGTFAVRVTNDDGTPAAGVGVTFTVTGSGSVSPTSTTTDITGVARTTVTAGNTAGQVTITATVTGRPLTAVATLVVTAAGPVTCTAPALGAETSYQGLSAACVTGGASGAEYVVIAFNTSATTTATTTLTGSGLGTPPSSTVLSPSAALTYRGESSASSSLRADEGFHQRLQQRSAELAPQIPSARRWQEARRRARSSTSLSAEGSVATHGIIPSNPQVGQVLSLNVNANVPCLSPDFRGTRIVAVGSRSVVLADTANPAGGFTTADYERFAARFDTLVYPLDVTNFGAPSDIDGNGRVGIVFTRAVNELTEKSSSSFVGGFFFSRDLFPKDSTQMFGRGCLGSNEGELFYMLAPDPTGIAYKGTDGTASSTNIRRTGFVDSITTATIAHEFQHLINASRRIYVNQGASAFEIVWLNEGLSHIAEELLYYRESGKQPRMNQDDRAIRSSPEQFAIWRQDAASNFGRFASYLRDPEKQSPVSENDQLAVRGATWAFLRYAADQKFAADGDVWFRLANSVRQGFATLSLVFANETPSLLRDWTVANYVDDTGFSGEVRYMHKSWNFRDIYTRTFVAGVYPLKVTGLANSSSQAVSVVQNSAAYYRFSVPANGEGRLELGGTSPQAAPLQFIVIRTR